MIRADAAYLLQQVTEAGSRAFSGDRALARRKALDAAEVAIASRKGGRKEHEAKRSVPSPATLPVGETRGFGGKAPGTSSTTTNNIDGRCALSERTRGAVFVSRPPLVTGGKI